jgi:hypothetical protein
MTSVSLRAPRKSRRMSVPRTPLTSRSSAVQRYFHVCMCLCRSALHDDPARTLYRNFPATWSRSASCPEGSSLWRSSARQNHTSCLGQSLSLSSCGFSSSQSSSSARSVPACFESADESAAKRFRLLSLAPNFSWREGLVHALGRLRHKRLALGTGMPRSCRRSLLRVPATSPASQMPCSEVAFSYNFGTLAVDVEGGSHVASAVLRLALLVDHARARSSRQGADNQRGPDHRIYAGELPGD